MKKTKYKEKVMLKLAEMTVEEMRAYAKSKGIKLLFRNPVRIRNYIADELTKRKYPKDVIVDCDVKSKKHEEGTVLTITMNVEVYGRGIGKVRLATDKICKLVSQVDL